MSIEVDETQVSLLSERLSALLGFSDGVGDVVRNLLTIESRPDLLDYLTQLLGSDRQDQLRDFVDDVGRVQRGEVLQQANTTKAVIPEQKKAPAKLEIELKKRDAPKVVSAVEKKPLKRAAPKVGTGREKTPPTKSTPKVETAVIKPVIPPVAAVAAPPQKGQASFVCGCFGTVHTALSNCLHCGRISCEREGYDYCAFCGYMVKEKSKNRQNTDLIDAAAWELQQRLLSYDRQFAQRTVIVDDQADYYSNQANSTWLNESEQQEAAQLELQRHNEMHHRQKITLDLDV